MFCVYKSLNFIYLILMFMEVVMHREKIINFLISDGFNEKLVKELSNTELKRMFIISLCINSTFVF